MLLAVCEVALALQEWASYVTTAVSVSSSHAACP